MKLQLFGGRGSCYQNYYNPSSSSGADFDLFDLANEVDEDTEKLYNGKTEKLKEKSIHIKQSTDKIPEEIIIPNISKIDSMSRKYPQTASILGLKERDLDIRAGKLGRNTSACFVHDGTNFNKLQIILNKDLTLSSKKNVEADTKAQIDSGNWAKADPKEYINQTITHEYGHYVQKVLMELELKTKPGRERYEKMKETLKQASEKDKQAIVYAYSEDCATRYFKSIQRIRRKLFNDKNAQISKYGEESNREAFAEIFANLNCSKEPENLGKAMEVFLSKRMDVKNPLLKNLTNKED